MKPKLSPQALALLERRYGVEGVRAALGRAPIDPTQRDLLFRTKDATVFRAEAEAWVTWKGGQDARLIRVGVWASVIAAVASIIGIIVSVLAWLEPLGH